MIIDACERCGHTVFRIASSSLFGSHKCILNLGSMDLYIQSEHESVMKHNRLENSLVLVWIANCMQYIESTFRRPNLRPSNSDSFTLSSFDHRLVALVVGATSQWWMDRMGGFEENTLEFEEVTLADCTCTWCWSYILSRVDVGSSLYIPRWHLLLGHQAQNGPWTFAKSIMHLGL